MKIISGPGSFRFFLAMIVFVSHSTSLDLGKAAVYVFFILSGYWISSLWESRYAKTISPHLTFLISRIWRLFPIFGFCSAVSVGQLYLNGFDFTQIVPEKGRVIASSIIVLGYRSLQFKPNVPAWSLDVEVQLYLIAPVLLIICRSSRATVFLACVAISAGAYFLRDDITAAPYLALFCLGVMADQLRWRPSARLSVTSLGVIVAGIALCLASPYRGILLGGAHRDSFSWMNEYAQFAVALAAFPLAIHTTRLNGGKADGLLSEISYPFYLLHWPILGFMAVGAGSDLHRAAAMAASLSLSLLASLVLVAVMDRPINRRRSRWVARRIFERSEASRRPLPIFAGP